VNLFWSNRVWSEYSAQTQIPVPQHFGLHNPVESQPIFKPLAHIARPVRHTKSPVDTVTQRRGISTAAFRQAVHDSESCRVAERLPSQVQSTCYPIPGDFAPKWRAGICPHCRARIKIAVPDKEIPGGLVRHHCPREVGTFGHRARCLGICRNSRGTWRGNHKGLPEVLQRDSRYGAGVPTL
jgi:hypothetical protein